MGLGEKNELDNLRNVPLLDLTQTWTCPDSGALVSNDDEWCPFCELFYDAIEKEEETE